ncbi:YgjV family protein [Arthrobacter sp. Alg241-R88]|uniref:CBU_0592 family membrane protein n=1 Tax=Micrococcaceae TaxID=1268 RepID=UPI00196743E8|nr:YgjV family protein [Arthrobacter sp. Alg241-R88]
MELLWEIAGWAGAAAILSAYLSVSMGWLKAGRGFQTANLLGAIAFIINGTFHGAWPSVVTNVAWFLISAIALIRMRSTDQPPAAPVEAPPVQFPGVPDTTGQIAVVEAVTAAVHGDVPARAAACHASLGHESSLHSVPMAAGVHEGR